MSATCVTHNNLYRLSAIKNELILKLNDKGV